MANKRISELTSASALAGTEVLPVVQGGTTKKVTAQAIADLASGGGGGAAGFDVTANGVLGGSQINVSYTTRSVVDTTVNMSQGYSVPVDTYASFNYSAQNPSGYGGGYGVNTTATNVSFHLKYGTDITLNTGTTITTLTFPEMLVLSTNMMGSNISGSALTSLNFPKLTSSAGINFNSIPSLTTLNFPSLVNFPSFSGLNIQGPNVISAITSASFPVLEDVQFNFYEPGSLLTINLPNAKKLKSVYIANSGMQTGQSKITTYNLPGLLEIANSIQVENHSTLVNVSIGTVGTLKQFSASWKYISFSGCSLNQASVDGILTALASLDGTNGTTIANYGAINVSGGNNAEPSSVGLAAKDVLLARGWQVSYTNQ